MITDQGIKKLIKEHIQGTDIFLVEVVIKPGNVIKVHADTPEGISIDECVNISRWLNSRLDRDDEDYSLEVSSPGLGGYFKVRQQYLKNVGRHIEVMMTDGLKISGSLLSVSEKGIHLKEKGEEMEIMYEEIKTAKAIIAFN